MHKHVIIFLGQVNQLKATALSSSIISVNWKYPKNPNGIITLYELTVKDFDDKLVENLEIFLTKVKCL